MSLPPSNLKEIGLTVRGSEHRDYEILLQRIRDALGTEEDGDALVEVARAAHRAERKCARIVRELDEVRNELEEDFDVIDGSDGQPRPNKAMRLANMIDEAIYGPGAY